MIREIEGLLIKGLYLTGAANFLLGLAVNFSRGEFRFDQTHDAAKWGVGIIAFALLWNIKRNTDRQN